jgi:ABC-2 type transport system permease protein
MNKINTIFKSLKLHFRTYLALMRFSLSRSLEFRFDFFFRFFMDCFFYAVTIIFFEVLFLHTDNLAGWQRHEVMLFVSGGLLIDGIYMTAIARNIWEMPALINKGQLDFQIIRPVSSLFFVMTRNFEFASLLNIFVALGIMIYAINLFPTLPSILEFIAYAFLILNGVILISCLRLFTVLPVFWTHSDYGFHMLFMSLEQVSEKPEVIFRGISHIIFTTILPFLVITSYPARYFFGELSITEYFYAVFLTCLFALLAYLLWRKGLRAYSSASS